MTKSQQLMPTPGKQPVTEQVIADLKARTAVGIKKYGRPLETHNGRDALQDAYEESLDKTQYLKQELLQRKDFKELLRVIAVRGSHGHWTLPLIDAVLGEGTCTRWLEEDELRRERDSK